jgi:hypothetical protein
MKPQSIFYKILRSLLLKINLRYLRLIYGECTPMILQWNHTLRSRIVSLLLLSTMVPSRE